MQTCRSGMFGSGFGAFSSEKVAKKIRILCLLAQREKIITIFLSNDAD